MNNIAGLDPARLPQLPEHQYRCSLETLAPLSRQSSRASARMTWYREKVAKIERGHGKSLVKEKWKGGNGKTLEMEIQHVRFCQAEQSERSRGVAFAVSPSVPAN